MTRTRPIRPYINKKSVLFGVRLNDLWYVGGAFFISLSIPLVFNLRLYGIQLALPLSIFTLLATGAFFNYVRIKHRPRWLEHEAATWWRDLVGIGNNIRCRTTTERKPRKWILDLEEKAKGN
jgi:hypothetical protein